MIEAEGYSMVVRCDNPGHNGPQQYQYSGFTKSDCYKSMTSESWIRQKGGITICPDCRERLEETKNALKKQPKFKGDYYAKSNRLVF